MARGQLRIPKNNYVKFLQLNQLDALISQIYFWSKTLHVSDRGTVRNMQSFTPKINLRN